MSFGDRLKEARIMKGYTQKQLAEKLNIGGTTVTGYEKDNSEPSMNTISKIMEILDVDANFLFQDESYETTQKEKELSEKIKNLAKKYRDLDSFGRQTVDIVLDREITRVKELSNMKERMKELESTRSAIVDIQPPPEDVNLYIYPYLGKIACAGPGFYFDDIPADTIEAPYVKGADFVVGVNGESMEPDYHDGEKLYVKKVEYLRTGDTGIFTIGNECFLKEFGKDGLISKNKDYDDIQGNEDVRLVGKVIGKVEI